MGLLPSATLLLWHNNKVVIIIIIIIILFYFKTFLIRKFVIDTINLFGAGPILKLLARLLPELYSTWSSYYYLLTIHNYLQYREV